MALVEVLIIAVGLAMDAFAVSVAEGCIDTKLRLKSALKMALFFGSFQAIMPIIGWFAGLSIKKHVEGYDHWVAFGLLCFIGGKMIYESTRLDEKKSSFDIESLYVLFVLSIATSIDALAVWFTLSFLKLAIVMPAIIIGVVTFVTSLGGVYIGKRFGHFFESKIEFIGGLILIGIGIKILLEHI